MCATCVCVCVVVVVCAKKERLHASKGKERRGGCRQEQAGRVNGGQGCGGVGGLAGSK